MKKIISLVLAFVLIFSFGVTSFALESSEYYLYQIWERFADVSYDIVDITDNTTSMLELLTALQYTVDIYYKSMFGNVIWGEPLGISIQNALRTIVDSVANPEDEALKESQKENQQFITETFFTPGSGLSLNTSDLSNVAGQFTSFSTFFDFGSQTGNVSPFELLSDGSEFSQWFTVETGQNMDPTFSASGGGGGETPGPEPDDPNPDEPDPDDPDPDDPDPDDPDPDDPDPDNPDPDNPDPDEPDPDEPDPDDPDPDEPDPDDPDEPTSVNLIPTSTTEPGGSEIFNGTGYINGYNLSADGSINKSTNFNASGWINLDSSIENTVYFQNIVFYKSSSGSFARSVVAIKIDDSVLIYSTANLRPLVDENGVTVLALPVGTEAFRFCAQSDLAEGFVSVNAYPPITSSVSTFSFRSPSYSAEPEIVTSFYEDRMSEYFAWFGGGN